MLKQLIAIFACHFDIVLLLPITNVNLCPNVIDINAKTVNSYRVIQSEKLRLRDNGNIHVYGIPLPVE